MQHIGKSKIGSLSARKGVKYPQLRLPQQCADVIGHTADILETESGGKRAFLIVTEQVMPKGDSVLKQSKEVLKPEPYRGLDQRLSALESQITELKSLLLENENQEAPQSPLFRQSTQKTNGLGRIRTGDLRRVKATS